MHLVVCYDVVEDKRRTRLFKGLCGFLRPVQKSVFEGHVPESRFPALVDLVEGEIDAETDTVRIYHLCRGCRGQTDLIGTSVRVPTEPVDIII